MKLFSFKGKIKKAVLCVPLLVMSAFPGITGAEGITDAELAKESVSNFIEAAQSGNISDAVKWVVDTRFESTEEQVEQYKDSISSNPFSNASIKSIVPASENSFTASVDLTRKDTGEINNVLYPVIKQGDTWKVLINGQETMNNRVKKFIQLQEDKSAALPLASTHLGSYGDSLVKAGKSEYSNQFNMTEDRIGITGWQQIPGSLTKVDVRYSVVKKGIFSDDVYGQSFHNGMNYWDGEAFYTTVYTAGQTYSNVYLKVTNEDLGNTVRVKGHIYGN
ncbi:DUF4878 domain-containing protein [Paenibacillus donghaensis]|uniref:DUF4878 domain-containing protein n=1 Tax=Paenibacillus donghaensis TaxID=414771 RepID=UPI001883A2B3|nr:DUF4878 domain-containing protein [Paenibacillus donghaensis]MBE9917414.1 DUF4878 domain-containing protein [Paenibacillus donghaensis]